MLNGSSTFSSQRNTSNGSEEDMNYGQSSEHNKDTNSVNTSIQLENQEISITHQIEDSKEVPEIPKYMQIRSKTDTYLPTNVSMNPRKSISLYESEDIDRIKKSMFNTQHEFVNFKMNHRDFVFLCELANAADIERIRLMEKYGEQMFEKNKTKNGEIRRGFQGRVGRPKRNVFNHTFINDYEFKDKVNPVFIPLDRYNRNKRNRYNDTTEKLQQTVRPIGSANQGITKRRKPETESYKSSTEMSGDDFTQTNIDIPSNIFEKVFHENMSKLICPYEGCNKGFPTIARAKRHYIIHTEERPYKCPNIGCNKRFSRRDNMNQHCKIHCKFAPKNN